MPANDPEKKTSPVAGLEASPWRYQAGFCTWLVLIQSPGSAALALAGTANVSAIAAIAARLIA
jgi:hypothetical protein